MLFRSWPCLSLQWLTAHQLRLPHLFDVDINHCAPGVENLPEGCSTDGSHLSQDELHNLLNVCDIMRDITHQSHVPSERSQHSAACTGGDSAQPVDDSSTDALESVFDDMIAADMLQQGRGELPSYGDEEYLRAWNSDIEYMSFGNE